MVGTITRVTSTVPTIPRSRGRPVPNPVHPTRARQGNRCCALASGRAQPGNSTRPAIQPARLRQRPFPLHDGKLPGDTPQRKRCLKWTFRLYYCLLGTRSRFKNCSAFSPYVCFVIFLTVQIRKIWHNDFIND